MSDSPRTSPEDLIDVDFRASILTDAKTMLDQIKRKSISGVLKKKIEAYYGMADKKDYFSHIFLRFLILCDSVMTGVDRGGEKVQGIFISKRIGSQINAYTNPQDNPPRDLVQTLEDAIIVLRRDLWEDDEEAPRRAAEKAKEVADLLKPVD